MLQVYASMYADTAERLKIVANTLKEAGYVIARNTDTSVQIMKEDPDPVEEEEE